MLENKWKITKKEKPDSPRLVLGYAPRAEAYLVTFYDGTKEQWFFDGKYGPVINRFFISHWQELPEPPEGI